MKKYIKIFIVIMVLSVIAVTLSWLLFFSYSINEMIIVFLPFISIIISTLYVIKKAKSLKSRIILILINPTIYYLIIVLLIIITISIEGFEFGKELMR